MKNTNTDTLTDNELSQVLGGNTTPGHDRHGGVGAVEREFNEWLAAHPITFPTPPISPPVP
ncbi:MAG: bacteriocin [Deltaproteobacteria bacterium]